MVVGALEQYILQFGGVFTSFSVWKAGDVQNQEA